MINEGYAKINRFRKNASFIVWWKVSKLEHI